MHLNICKIKTYKKLCLLTLWSVFLFFIPNIQASENPNTEKNFDAGSTIIGHVVDAYEWHIMTINDKHISIYLPVILYHDGKIHLFSSSKFHHGHESYAGFAICQEKGANKGKIIKVDEEGNMDKDAFFIDLSITKNVLSLFISILLLTLIILSAARSYKKNGHGAPKGIARIIEPILLFIKDGAIVPSIGPKHEKYTPFLLTLFFFILFNNLFGLIPFFPGGANLTGNISVTLILALFTFIVTTVSGNKHYWKDIFNTPGIPWWLKVPIPLMPIVELIGVFTKPIILMIRLFANITAGHIIALGFICLIFILGETNLSAGYGVSIASVIFYVFMGFIELLVVFIQAYVFTLLSAIYIGMAVKEHEEEHELKEIH